MYCAIWLPLDHSVNTDWASLCVRQAGRQTTIWPQWTFCFWKNYKTGLKQIIVKNILWGNNYIHLFFQWSTALLAVWEMEREKGNYCMQCFCKLSIIQFWMPVNKLQSFKLVFTALMVNQRNRHLKCSYILNMCLFFGNLSFFSQQWSINQKNHIFMKINLSF